MFTEEQLAFLRKFLADELGNTVSTTVNSAVSSHLKRADGKRTEETQALLDAAFAKFREEQEEAAKKTPPAPVADPTKPSPEFAAELAKRDKAIAEMAAKFEQADRQREAAEKQAREDKTFAELTTALGPVKEEFRDMIIKSWKVDGRVSYDDEGRAVMKVRKAQFKGGVEEDVLLPLGDAVKTWLESKEAQSFLPPPTRPNPTQPKPAPPMNFTLPRNTGDGEQPALSDEQRVAQAADIAARIRASGNF